MPIRIALMLALLVQVVAAADVYKMPDRVYCDVEAGISFRCPYEWTMPDQYVGEFLPAGTKKTVVVKGEPREIETWVTGRDGKPKPILRHVGFSRAALPPGCLLYTSDAADDM
jgi:hypothetical protein